MAGAVADEFFEVEVLFELHGDADDGFACVCSCIYGALAAVDDGKIDLFMKVW